MFKIAPALNYLRQYIHTIIIMCKHNTYLHIVWHAIHKVFVKQNIYQQVSTSKPHVLLHNQNKPHIDIKHRTCGTDIIISTYNIKRCGRSCVHAKHYQNRLVNMLLLCYKGLIFTKYWKLLKHNRLYNLACLLWNLHCLNIRQLSMFSTCIYAPHLYL